MTPASFPQANRNLTAPAGMTREECGDLPTFTDGRHCISLWALSWRERLHVLLTGRVWLWVWSGETQPPVALATENPFVPLDGPKEGAAALLSVALILLLAGCGGNPRPQPPVVNPPAPVVSPSPAPSAEPPPITPEPPPLGGCPPGTYWADGQHGEKRGCIPETPTDPDGKVAICHIEQPSDGQDRFQLTLRLTRERAAWHLEHHDRDHRGECKAREGAGL